MQGFRHASIVGSYRRINASKNKEEEDTGFGKYGIQSRKFNRRSRMPAMQPSREQPAQIGTREQIQKVRSSRFRKMELMYECTVIFSDRTPGMLENSEEINHRYMET